MIKITIESIDKGEQVLSVSKVALGAPIKLLKANEVTLECGEYLCRIPNDALYVFQVLPGPGTTCELNPQAELWRKCL